MKIALFTDTYYPQVNGVARTLKRYTDHMAKRNIECELFIPDMEGENIYPRVHQFTSVPFMLYPECRTAFALPTTIIEKVQAFSPDIIHVTTPLTMGLLGSYTAKKLQIPLVSSYHTHFDQYLDYYKLGWVTPLLWRYMKWFYSSSEKIFVPSEETRNHLIQHGFKNLSIWSRGVDCDAFHPFYDKLKVREKYGIKEKYVFLFVGRLAPEKDLSTLLETINTFPSHLDFDVHWLIVGDGPSYDDILEQVGQRKNVTMTGYMNGKELAQCYALADAFVFPSQTETFGNVVLESLASGTPAVVCDRGGVKGIVKHNVTGKICRAGDAGHFVEELVSLISNNRLLTSLSQEARKYALEQTWESIFDRLLNEYGETLISQSYKKLKEA